jgi:DHA2 family multidrug resistance protein
MGYSATMAGLTMAWNAALGVIMAPLAGLLLGRVDGRIIACVGLLWVVGTMWFRSNYTTDMTNFQIAWPILLMGAGLPVVFVPLTTLSLRSVDEHETASAAGLQNFVRTVFGAFATSIATTAWDYRTTHARTVLSGAVDHRGFASRGLQTMGMNDDMSVRVIDNMVQTQSAMIGLNQVMMATMVTFFICALLVWITPKPTHMLDMTRMGH